MVELYQSLSHGHQLANLIGVGSLVGGFCALVAWGAATEKRATPAPAKAADPAPAPPARSLATVDIPQFLRERNAA